jgi:hypothetical protein
MSKKVTLELEFKPNSIEFFGDYFALTYEKKEQENPVYSFLSTTKGGDID